MNCLPEVEEMAIMQRCWIDDNSVLICVLFVHGKYRNSRVGCYRQARGRVWDGLIAMELCRHMVKYGKYHIPWRDYWNKKCAVWTPRGWRALRAVVTWSADVPGHRLEGHSAECQTQCFTMRRCSLWQILRCERKWTWTEGLWRDRQRPHYWMMYTCGCGALQILLSQEPAHLLPLLVPTEWAFPPGL